MKKNAFNFKITHIWADGSITDAAGKTITYKGNEAVFKELSYLTEPLQGYKAKEIFKSIKRQQLLNELVKLDS